MAAVHIDLQDGFENDTVVLRLDGGEIYRRQDLTTQLLYGLADSIETRVEVGSVRLEIAVESRGLTLALPLDVSGDVFVGFAVEGAGIRPIVSDTPFGYG